MRWILFFFFSLLSSYKLSHLIYGRYFKTIFDFYFFINIFLLFFLNVFFSKYLLPCFSLILLPDLRCSQSIDLEAAHFFVSSFGRIDGRGFKPNRTQSTRRSSSIYRFAPTPPCQRCGLNQRNWNLERGVTVVIEVI